MTAASVATAAPEAGSAAATRSTATEFAFQHKVFQMPGGVFARTGAGDIAFHFMLGDLTAAIEVGVLAREFGIADASSDGHLLRTAVAGLRFVREIRPNDSIPRELLDGTASWSVEEWHRRRARSRLVLAVAAAAGNPASPPPEDERIDALAAAAERDPSYATAMEQLAARLELSSEQVSDRLAALTRELAYIEALRDLFRNIQRLPTALVQIGQIYRRDETLFQAVLRTISLLQRPIREFVDRFHRTDALTAGIAELLRRHHAQIAVIRQTRDDVHERTMVWGQIPQQWAELEISRSEPVENKAKELYRFVAYHFPQAVDWRSTPKS
ncbi:MAG: hypothetical protein JO305_04950 [Alphaproteobacteria bacterium]|nr:hypothetical protein [Alphaproteobacteria bacterium]